jgi:osmotically-inducible protein OsmY
MMTITMSGCATLRGHLFGGNSEDAQITANVVATLKARADLGPANRVIVQTRNRVVYLDGTVATDLQRKNAESVAMQAEGVDLVVNTISLGH